MNIHEIIRREDIHNLIKEHCLTKYTEEYILENLNKINEVPEEYPDLIKNNLDENDRNRKLILFNLRNPKSNSYLKIPARCINCTISHQNMEFEELIKSIAYKRNCPICDEKKINVDQIMIDVFLYEIISIINSNYEIKSKEPNYLVLFKDDMSWTVI